MIVYKGTVEERRQMDKLTAVSDMVLTMAIQQVLENNSGRCLDNEEERSIVTSDLASELSKLVAKDLLKKVRI
jgi:hypothetical protein